jgi:hypothetical protein
VLKWHLLLKLEEVASVDPFKKVTNMNPQQFITDNTNAAKMTQSALDPVTSQGESMVKEEAEKATNGTNSYTTSRFWCFEGRYSTNETWWISSWSTNSSKRL